MVIVLPLGLLIVVWIAALPGPASRRSALRKNRRLPRAEITSAFARRRPGYGATGEHCPNNGELVRNVFVLQKPRSLRGSNVVFSGQQNCQQMAVKESARVVGKSLDY